MIETAIFCGIFLIFGVFLGKKSKNLEIKRLKVEVNKSNDIHTALMLCSYELSPDKTVSMVEHLATKFIEEAAKINKQIFNETL